MSDLICVVAPPVFIKTPPGLLEVMLGESLTLRCDAHGNPKPTITWRRDDRTVEDYDAFEVKMNLSAY